MQWVTFCCLFAHVHCGLYGLTSSTPQFGDILLVEMDPVTGEQTPTGTAVPNWSLAGIQQAQKGSQNMVHWLSYDLDLSKNNSCFLNTNDLISGKLLYKVPMPFFEKQGFFGFSEMLVFDAITEEVVCLGILPNQPNLLRWVISINPATGAWRRITSFTIVADAGQASTFNPVINQALFQVGMETALIVKGIDMTTGQVTDYPEWNIATMDYHYYTGKIYCATYEGEVWGLASFSTAKDWTYIGELTPGGWLGINNQYSALEGPLGILYLQLYNVSGGDTMYLVGVDIRTAKEVSVTLMKKYPPPRAMIVSEGMPTLSHK